MASDMGSLGDSTAPAITAAIGSSTAAKLLARTSKTTTTNETGAGFQKLAENAVDWVGLEESGLKKKAIDFIRGPTPLKARDLNDKEFAQVLNTIDVVDDEVHQLEPSEAAKPSIIAEMCAYLKRHVLGDAKGFFAALDYSTGNSMVIEEQKILGCVLEIEQEVAKVNAKASAREAERKHSEANGGAEKWQHLAEWREKALLCLLDWVAVDAAAVKENLDAAVRT